MEELSKSLFNYKSKTKANNEDCAKLLGLTIEQINDIEKCSLILDEQEQNRLISILQSKTKSHGKKIIKILELIFKFIAMIMPLVVLLLCINGYDNNKILIIILAIGAITTSILSLPRNEK